MLSLKKKKIWRQIKMFPNWIHSTLFWICWISYSVIFLLMWSWLIMLIIVNDCAELYGYMYVYILYGIGSCNYKGWQAPRSVGWVNKFETQGSQGFSYSLSPKAWEPEEPMFQFEYKGRKKLMFQLKAVR